MQITAIKNIYGHIHIFKGNVVGKLTNYGSTVELDGKESDIYIQAQSDIEGFELFLSEEQKEELNNGYSIAINDDMGYFP